MVKNRSTSVLEVKSPKRATASPRVSVVLPTYNRASLLPRAVLSVLAQTFADYEVVIVDDGSTDNTQEVLARFDDPRIRLLSRRENRGVSRSRNEAIRAARGEFIAFLDSDDEWLPSVLERHLARLEEVDNPNVSMVYCFYYVEKPSHEGEPRFFDAILHEGDVYDRMLEGWMPLPSATMIKREKILAVGGFDEDLPQHEDYDLMLRLGAASNQMIAVAEPLVVYHNHGGPRLTSSHLERLDYYEILKDRWGPVIRDHLGLSGYRRWTARQSLGLRFHAVRVAVSRGDRKAALRHCWALSKSLPYCGSLPVFGSALVLALLGPAPHEAARRVKQAFVRSQARS